jgi:hypothetical protein
MVYCPKCGNKVLDDVNFCNNCGASLRAGPPPPAVQPRVSYEYRRDEKREKQEKGEKREKDEKSEKHEGGPFSIIGPAIGGLFLIFLGVIFLYPNQLNRTYTWAAFFMAIGVAVIIVALYGFLRASKRNPLP